MSLVDRAKNILLKPKEEWQVIATETPDTGALVGGYMVPLALLSAVASIIGAAILGSVMMGVATGLMVLIASIIGVFVTAAVINALAPTFNSEQNFGRALQLVVYSNTAAWVGGLLNVIPVLGAVLAAIAGLYGIYLLYTGFTPIMKTPEDKVIVYMIVAVVALMAVYFIMMAILGGILFTALGVGAVGAGMLTQ
jgi:hypothetical protein